MRKQVILLIAVLTFAAPRFTRSDNSGSEAIPDSTQQVVGGEDAAIEEYQWLAALVSSKSLGNTGQFCGATAIAPYWILTAAHCVDESRKPENFKVVFGTADLEDETTAQVFYPKTIVIHPDYINSYNSENDIALVQLREPLPDSIPKVPLVTQPSMESPGNSARLIGWGITSTDFRNRQDTMILQEVDMAIVTQVFANLPEYYGGSVHENMIAAGNFDPYSSSGTGDSGGPLLAFNEALNRWEQIGISNFGAGCDKPNNPISAYARVSTHLDWINNILQNDFLSWALDHELPDLSYNEGDDHTPLTEYILGLDPTAIDHPQSELFGTTSWGETIIMGTLRLRNGAPPIHLIRERSTDLVQWMPAELDFEGISQEIDGDLRHTLYHIPVIRNFHDEGFYRVGLEEYRGMIHGPYTLRVGSSAKGLFNRGPEANGPTHYDYLIDTLGSLRQIGITALSSIDQPFTMTAVDLETGQPIFDTTRSALFDSESYPFSEGIWPQDGKQYLVRLSSLDGGLPQDFEILLYQFDEVIDSSTQETYFGSLTGEDSSYKRENHFADTHRRGFGANIMGKIEVASETLDLIIFIHDARTGELIEEVDEKPSGESESVLLRFDTNKSLIITITSYKPNDTGDYTLKVSQFSERRFIEAGEKTIGLIHSADKTTDIDGTTYYVEEIDLVNIHHPAGVTVKIKGYDRYYPSYLIYDLTAEETIHSAIARCQDRTFHFNPNSAHNYRFVLLASQGRIGNNYELEIINGEIQEEADFGTVYSSPKQQQHHSDEIASEWNVIHKLYGDN